MSQQKGPLPRFSEIHVRMALDIVAKHGRVGRKQLTEELGVGEGSVRTILNQLKERELITSSRGGHALTAKGRRSLGKPFELIQVDVGGLTVGEVNVATIVRGAAAKVKRGIEQRDEAIKAGAAGATVLIFREGKLQFPGGFLKVGKRPTEVLMKSFNPREGDVIIIGSARDVVTAEAGAKAAARSLASLRY
ncbi:MAG: DUF4443 domain-containing protein [Hadesarchaea archaeon]|nr:DUF4443 domain-containing protein [Hadesarchaea archaeon]